jgi:hypothetical protein
MEKTCLLVITASHEEWHTLNGVREWPLSSKRKRKPMMLRMDMMRTDTHEEDESDHSSSAVSMANIDMFLVAPVSLLAYAAMVAVM